MLQQSKTTSFEVFSNPNKLNGNLDKPTLHITIEKLNGKIFLEWFHSVKLFLRSKMKMGYILGTIKVPKTTNPLFESWDFENSMIMSRLLNYMQPEIWKTFLFQSTAKDIWDVVVKTHSKKGNATRIFELKHAIHETKQRDLDVLSYFNKLKNPR